MLQSHEGEMGILLFITSLFPPKLLYVNEMTFRKHPRMGGGGGLVARGINHVIRRLELSVPLPEGRRVEG